MKACFRMVREHKILGPRQDHGRGRREAAEEIRMPICAFILDLAEAHGLQNPADRGKRVLLPVAMSRQAIFKIYNENRGASRVVYARYLRGLLGK